MHKSIIALMLSTVLSMSLLGYANNINTMTTIKKSPIGAETAIPPRYLSIPQWQACMGTQVIDTYTIYCLPATQKAGCSTTTWQALNQLSGKDALPHCGKNSKRNSK